MMDENSDLFSFSDEQAEFSLSTFSERSIDGHFNEKKSRLSRFELIVRYLNGSLGHMSIWSDTNSNRQSSNNSRLSNYTHSSFHHEFEREIDAGYVIFPHSPENNTVLTIDNDSDDNDSNLIKIDSADLIIFDVSDLIYYIGHHDNLTGIQRVQACVIIAMTSENRMSAVKYISFDNNAQEFRALNSDVLIGILKDLMKPIKDRIIIFDKILARLGILEPSSSLEQIFMNSQYKNSVIYLLGAAWVNHDYFYKINQIKSQFNCRFFMTIHDLIPIYARETCDQGTATVFEEFLRKSLYFVDRYIAVSENTAHDLHRFASGLGFHDPSISVVRNAHTLESDVSMRAASATISSSQKRGEREYCLFVSTIEGRKNHDFVFDVWSELKKRHSTVPDLICVGRLGWRAEKFLEKMLSTANLGGSIIIKSDISDLELTELYENALFTIYPSSYEGWGLPVGESLSYGKVCITSDTSSLPEVGGDFAVYIDVSSIKKSMKIVERLIYNRSELIDLENKIRTYFVPRTWENVASEIIQQCSRIVGSPRSPTLKLELGREYKLSSLPSRNYNVLGQQMALALIRDRTSSISNRVNSDEDIIVAQSMRAGSNWCQPEPWGTWSRYPTSSHKISISRQVHGRLHVYVQLRVVGLLVGTRLEVRCCETVLASKIISNDRFQIRFIVPDRLIDGINTAEVSYTISDLSQEQHAELLRIDGRGLGLGFDSILLFDDKSLDLRVSALESIIFRDETSSLNIDEF